MLSTILRAPRAKAAAGVGAGRAGEPQPVLVVDRDDEADLARQIEPMEVVSFGLEDHRVSGGANMEP